MNLRLLTVFPSGLLLLGSLSSCSGPQDPPVALSAGAASSRPGTLTSTPLSPPSRPAAPGGTLFSTLDPAVTGLNFANRILPDHPLKFLYATEKVCGGVAVGDLNGDGKPDLYFTSGPEQNRLFLQTGNLTFTDHTAAAGVDGGGAWSSGAAIADIDGDGDLDIYVASYAAPNLLYLNRGDATFDERAAAFGLDRLSASHMPAFCDYDRDGDLDLFLLTNRFHSPAGQPESSEVLRFEPVNGVMRISFSDPLLANYFRPYQSGTGSDGRPIFKITPVGQPDVLFRNNGDNTFSDVSAAAGISGTGFGLSATWWDYNQDGWPDLWVGNDFDDPDRIYRNNRDGTFTDVVKTLVPHTTWFSMGADHADLDGDGHSDFLIADMSGTNHFKQKTNMGSMGAKAEFLRTANPRQYMRNALFLGTGTERLREAAQMAGLANSDWTWTVKLSDLDCDGLPDVFMTNGMSRNFNESDNAAVKALPNETEWDRHLRADTAELREPNLAFRNLSDLHFEKSGTPWGLDHNGMSFAAAHADLDGDGDLDLIVCNLNEPVSLLRNDTPDGHRMVIRLLSSSQNRNGIGASVTLTDSSGRTQIQELAPVRGYLSSNEPLLHFGLGGSTPESLTVRWPGGHRQDFTGLLPDQFLTITEPSGPAAPAPPPPAPPALYTATGLLSGASHTENEFDDFQKQLLLPNQMSRLGPGMAWGDFDGDGDPDLWVGGAAGHPGQLWRNEHGKFTAVPSPALEADAASEDMAGLWFDADGDGDPDLCVVSGGYEFDPGSPLLRDRLYLNQDGILTKASAAAFPAPAVSGAAAAAADYDRDGDLDLFLGGRQTPGAYPEPAPSLLFNNKNGEFTPAPLTLTGLITSALWSDIDRDGWIDLLTTEEWGPVRVFHNRQGVLTEITADAGPASLTGWWNGITGADLDGDGDIDYIATNYGLNTKYHASAAHPTLLYYGDFEGSGPKQIVEAEFENTTLYPVRGRSCSSTAMPHLRDTFTTFKKFAASELTEIYPVEKLDSSLRLAATSLQSGVFLNETVPGGPVRLTFHPLPRIAQIAPSFGVVTTDANHDGIPDVYLAQNSWSPQVETGRMDGGLGQLLLGVGDGSFSPVPPDQSGLIVPGDAASLTRADLDGDGSEDLLIGINNAAPAAFLQKSSTPALTISLTGPPGNPDAVGAIVSVLTDTGKTLTAEVSAGGGYLSQSPAALHFFPGQDSKFQEIKIRWPDGTAPVHPAPAAPGPLRIAHGP